MTSLRDDHVDGVAADVAVGVAGSVKGALVVEGGLDRELSPGSEFLLPLLADLHDLAAELVTDDDGMFGDVLRHALVLAALDRRLVR